MITKPSFLPVRCRAALLLLVLAYGAQLPAHAQPSRARPGVVSDSLLSDADPSQAHAVFLPSSYRADRSWPVLFLMDPRGRAMVPLERFRPAADSLGYILVSSWNTMSDGPDEPNVRALNAMLADAAATWSVDARRYYLVGFSGTARLSWSFAYQIPRNVAGVIGFGAGTAHGMVPAAQVQLEGKPFAFYGGGGYHDFNYLEMVELETHLELLSFHHKMVFYPGSHAWPSDQEWYDDALRWMHLRAMQTGSIETDTAFVRRYYAASLRQIGDSPDIYEEYKGLQDLMRSFEGLAEHPKAVRDRYRRLERSRDFRRLRDRIGALIGTYRDYNVRASGLLEGLLEQEADELPGADVLLRQLNAEQLREQAGDTTDAYGARAARVMLELAYVKASFYVPREALRRGEPRRALRSLQVAEGMLGSRFNTRLFRVLAHHALGQRERAMESLEELLQSGVPPAYLEGMAQLEELRDDPDFKALMNRYGGENRDGS